MEDLEQYINERVAVDAAGCWIWTQSIASNGYGNAWNGVTVLSAHRHMYTLLVGQVPEGLVLDHLCKVRRCVNPAHLEPVTQGENMRRAGWYQPGPVRSGCPIHGAEFMRVYRRKRSPLGVEGVCRECQNIKQRARRALLKPNTRA